jgi:septal ring factor EnvC (AmiA/AmiB activator)
MKRNTALVMTAVFAISFLALPNAHADKEKTSSQEQTQNSNKNENQEKRTSSTETVIDQVHETIKDAAVSNREFGKDISDR